MPAQLFTYYIEDPLVVLSLNNGSWGLMFVRLAIEIWGVHQGGTKREYRKWGG
jgi:hypothetical protein